MSSLKKENDRGRTGWRLRFSQSRKRRSLWLGDVSKRQAESITRNVDELVRAFESNTAPEPSVSKWADALSGRIRETLERWELVESISSQPDALGPYLDAYVKGRTDVKESTRTNFKQTRRLLVEKFGKDKSLRSITPADAERFRVWLLARPMAPASVAKHIKRCKQFFAFAVKDRLLTESPFQKIKVGSQANKERHHFIDAATTATVVAAMPDHDWRLIFGLARFAGMRCPSEVTRLRWSDVDFDGGRLRIDSTKTGLRFCPIFPELRPILENAAADRENDLVMNRRLIVGYGVDAQLGTQFKRLLERAGIEPWAKLWINCRSTRRTELQKQFPSHVVDSWLGHSTKTAETYYLQVTDEDWERATGGHNGGHRHAPSPTLSKTPAPIIPQQNAVGSTGTGVLMTPTGLLIHRKNRGKMLLALPLALLQIIFPDLPDKASLCDREPFETQIRVSRDLLEALDADE